MRLFRIIFINCQMHFLRRKETDIETSAKEEKRMQLDDGEQKGRVGK